MKIGITCYPGVGGSGILATRLGVELAKKGHQVHFITYERPYAIRGYDVPGLHVHLVPVEDYPLFKYTPYTVALASAMVKVSKAEGLQVLHVHYSIPHSTSALLAREVTGVPYVTTLHGSDVTLLGGSPSYEAINTHSVKQSDAVTTVSHFMAEEAREKLGITDVKVIPNFVDHDLFQPAPCRLLQSPRDCRLTLIHVSNFRPVKRIDDLVYAMCMIVKEEPTARLLLVGDGPERPRVERLIDRLELRGNIQLMGYRNDVPQLLNCSDALVLCSETENAPLTILEAMSCGLPVVATRVGGVPELVEDGSTGFLVPVKNPEAIAEKALLLARGEGLRDRMGERARRRVLERYTKEKVVDQYLELYESLAE